MPVLKASTRPFRRFRLHCRHNWLPNGAGVRHVQALGPTGHEIDNNRAFIHIEICHALPVVHFRKKARYFRGHSSLLRCLGCLCELEL